MSKIEIDSFELFLGCATLGRAEQSLSSIKNTIIGTQCHERDRKYNQKSQNMIKKNNNSEIFFP